MNRNSRNRLLLIFALFHLLADVAYAGASVLCVGADDHRAIEPEHVAEAGCQPSAESTPNDAGITNRAPSPSEDCSDSPLHSEAELVSSRDRTLDFAPDFVAISPSLFQAATSNTLVSPRPRAPAETTALRAHRTTVLII
jgi:hypothetical protein